MIIPITFPTASEKRLAPKLPGNLIKVSDTEYVLIELQGAIHCSDDKEREGEVVGRLSVDEALAKPTLIIGHHLLEGKLVKLPKPLALMRKEEGPLPPSQTQFDGHEEDEDEGVDDEGANDEGADLDEEGGEPGRGKGKKRSSGNVEWKIHALVKRKIVFSKRPSPI